MGIDLARRALHVGGDDAVALAYVAHVLGYFNEDIDAAIAIVDRSTALNPSGAYGWRFSGFQRLFAGQCELAIQHFEQSLRLSPREAGWSQRTGIAIAQFFSGRREAAVTTFLPFCRGCKRTRPIRWPIVFWRRATRIWGESTKREKLSLGFAPSPRW
jgi:adenylate cyclase